MTVHDLSLLHGIAMVESPDPQASITAGYTSDLLSDVVANCPADAVLLTIQAHANTVAVCTLVGAPAILVCGGRSVPEEMLVAARKEGIAVLTTPLNQFEASHAVKTALLSTPQP